MTRRTSPRATPGSSKATSRTPANAEAGTTRSSKATDRAAKTTAAKKPRPRARSRASTVKARASAGVRVIAVANQKGGVGKSTTAVSLGASLAELGYRVLVVDLDPQGNASTGLGIRHEARDVTVYDVLAAEAPIDGAIVESPVPGLYAIPSTIDLAGAEIELVSQFSRELRLRKALEPLKQGSFDFVFLDCPPSLGLLTVNALAAAQELIVPIQCEYYALEGLGQLLRNVGLVQQNVNPDLRLTGIVMTMYDPRTRLSEQVVQEVRRYFGDRVYRTVIPRTVRLSEAPGYGQPITVYDPKSRGAECYRELAKEVAAKLPVDEPLPVFDGLPTMSPLPPAEAEPMTAPRPLRHPGDLDTEHLEVEPEPAEAPEFAPEPEVEAATLAEAEVLEIAEWLEPAPEPEVEAAATAPPELAAATAPVPTVDVEEAWSAEQPPVEADEPPEAAATLETQPPPGSEGPASAPDADGAEEWIQALEAEARAEAEVVAPPVESLPMREIVLEPEPEPGPVVEPENVVRITDRDAAGDHEPAGGDAPQEDEDGAGKRRWSLFRRGGNR